VNRDELRNLSEKITRTDQKTLSEWFVTVFRSNEDGYQPPGEDVNLEVIRDQTRSRSPHTVHFMCPEMERT